MKKIVLLVMAACTSKPLTQRQSCAAGVVAACDALNEKWGSIELLPDGMPPAAEDAASLDSACQKKSVGVACVTLALMNHYGTATGKRDDGGAKPLWKRARDLDDLNGFRGEKPSDDGAAALVLAEKQCDAGRARACAQRGWAAFSGVQQDEDVPAAYKWYAKGCALKSAAACRWSGHIAYTHPEANAPDAAARTDLEASCAAGDPGGCDELGQFLADGGKPDEAAAHWETACTTGSRDGCLHAGMAKQKSDPAAARVSLCKACKAGQADACKAASPACE
jgi:TPR repeat protein